MARIPPLTSLTSSHAPRRPQIRPADQDLRDLRPAVCMAQEVGTGLGAGAVLLGSVPGENDAHDAWSR